MTMRRLPPLETLRVFEAVERHKSFKDAGDELGVPHTRRIEVTPEGARLAAGVRRGLLEFRHAVASIDRREGTHIRITGIPSHVTRWLAPRLHRFRSSHPDIELHITADLALVDLRQR